MSSAVSKNSAPLTPKAAARPQPKLYRRPQSAAPQTVPEAPLPSPQVEVEEHDTLTPEPDVTFAKNTLPATMEAADYAPNAVWRWDGRFAFALFATLIALNALLFWSLHATPSHTSAPLSLGETQDVKPAAPRVIQYIPAR